MNIKKCVAASLLCLLMVVLVVCGLSACADCSHEWGQWTVTKEADCYFMGMKERECTLCGEVEKEAIEAKGHDYGEWIDQVSATCGAVGQLGHYHCDGCGKDFDAKYNELTNLAVVIDHVWVDATCTAPKTCQNCGTTEGEALGHTGGTASCSAKAVCTRCNLAYGDLLDHVWTDATCTAPKTCQNCDKTEGNALGHTGGTASCSSKAICTRCNKAYGEFAPHDWNAATCTAPKSCKNCVATEGDALGHTGGTATCQQRAACTRCQSEYGALLTHVYNQQNTDAAYRKSAATCDAKAVYYYSCTCGMKGSETFEYGSALGHSWTNWRSNGDGTHTRTCYNHTTPFTETDECSGGETSCTDYAVCAICDSEYGDTPAHAWDSGVATTNPTCTVNGVRTYTCSECSATKTESIDALEHSYDDGVVTAPTCTEKGYTTYTCTRRGCGYSYTDDEVEANGHTWDRQERTCTEGRTCTVSGCGVTEPALGHGNYVLDSTKSTPATCTAAATETYVCDRCHADENVVTLGSALGHNIEGVEAVETQIGETCAYQQTFACQREECDVDVPGQTVYHHDHVGTITKQATCLEDGVMTFTCQNENCDPNTENYTYTNSIAKGDSYHKWVVDTDAEPVEGKRFEKCANECGDEKCTAKREVSVSETNTTTGTASDLQNADLELKVDSQDGTKENVGVNLGNALDGTDVTDVTLSVEKLEGSERPQMTDDMLAQIDDNPVYNFTINNGDVHKFGDFVTVTLPYTLMVGEDADAIFIWFVATDEENKPTVESVKAEFKEDYKDDDGNSVGYVTFKTNHFSYYTVTRLTPAQRCEFYGQHSYVETTVTGDCLNDSYILKVCVRCHDTKKEVTVAADGHNFSEDSTTNATCTASGKTVYKCADCTETYEVTIPATGHAWAVSESVAATCSASGSIVYTCGNDNCDVTYTETLAQLKHSFTETVVAPTCEENGYTVHSCTNENCTYSYNDTIISASGHNYAPVWNWADDYSSVTVTFVCANNEAHTLQGEAVLTTKTVGATCTHGERSEYTAKVTHNGVAYTDKKAGDEGRPLDHNYAPDWKYDKDHHHHICPDCGEKADVTEHDFSVSTITKQATCVEAGERIYACVCGATKSEVIPATGNHLFENGVCVDCGKRDGACDHTELVDASINFADYGICDGGILNYKTCECGEVVMVEDEDDLEGVLDCDFEYLDEEEGVDENGVPYMTGKMVCRDCGLTVDEYAYAEIDGCIWTIIYSYDFTINGIVILEDLNIEYIDEEHETTYTVVDLSKYSTCGGTLNAYVCSACGEITSIVSVHAGCNGGDLEGIMQTEQFTDENGIQHIIATVDCPDCDLKFVQEMTVDVRSVCETHRTTTISVYYKDTLLAEDEENSMSSSHEYEYTYDIEEGKTCDDGYTVTAYCDKCGKSYSHKTYGHRYTDLRIDLSEHTDCGGSIHAYGCEICGKISDIWDMNINCDGEETEETVTVDGVEHERYTMICDACGLKFVQEEWEVITSACISDYYLSIVITDGDTVIFEGTINEHDEDHDYEYSAEMRGETCEEGFDLTRTCTVCGDVYSDVWYGHYTVSETVDLSELGLCGGTIETDVCVACGEVFYSWVNTECYWNQVDTNDDGYNVYECEWCGAIRWHKRTSSEKDENCQYTTTDSTIYFVNGEEVYNWTREYISESHNYQYTYDLEDGKTCEDGYNVYVRCADCGYSYNSYWIGHRVDKSTRVDLHELGMCWGDYAYKYVCEVCGTVTGGGVETYACDWEFVETDADGYDVSKCRNCGTFRYEKVVNTPKDENCEYTTTRTQKFVLNSETIYEFERSYTDTAHNWQLSFSMNGDSCEDGYEVTEYCPDCKSSHTWEGRDHSTYLKAEYDLADYGACSGSVHYYACPCGENAWVDYSNLCKDYTYNYNEYLDDDGYMHYVRTYDCDECGMRFTREYYGVKSTDACEIVYHYSYIVQVGTQLVANIEYTTTEEQHAYVASGALMDGATSCEDGAIITYTCKDCGESYTNEIHWHETYELERIDLDQYGSVCHGYAVLYGCACGYTKNLDMDHALCELDYVNKDLEIEGSITGYHFNHMYESYSYYSKYSEVISCSITNPEQCELRIAYSTYWLKDANDCRAYRYQRWLFGYNAETGEYEYELTFKTGDERVYHTYGEDTQLTDNDATDGLTMTGTKRTCTACGGYCEYRYYNDADGNLVKEEYEAFNTLANGDYQYRLSIEENDGVITRGYHKYVHSDGREETSESIRDDSYTAFGLNGYEYTSIYIYNGSKQMQQYAYVYYEGHSVLVYNYILWQDGSWENTELSAPGCTRTQTYTNSNGENTVTEITEHCGCWNWKTVKAATCTQPGEMHRICCFCEQAIETTAITPAHDWVYVSDDQYFCGVCGLENINGASGDIIMEDLTAQYGNGEKYVVGYYAGNDVEFTYYVSLILADETEVVLGQIIPEQLTEVCAFAFSKADVIAAAEALGYSADEYDVRFAFVPYGSDGSFDYAITFTEEVEVETVTDDVQFLHHFAANETLELTLTSTENSVWDINAYTNRYVYISVYDANDDCIAWGSGSVSFEMPGDGESYRVEIQCEYDTYVMLDFVSTPVTE